MENINIILDKIQPVLTELSNKLGVASEHLWRILIRQQYVDGFIGLLEFGIGVGLLIIAYKIIKYYFIEEEEGGNSYDNNGWIAIGIVMVMVGFLFSIVGIESAINHFVNPEFQALKDILQLLNPPK